MEVRVEVGFVCDLCVCVILGFVDLGMACPHVCMHACMHVCMRVCMYVCMYVVGHTLMAETTFARPCARKPPA